MLNKPKYIIIHCTDVSDKVAWDQFYSVNLYHKGLDFIKSSLGYYVGYHRLITGGKNYKCKEDTEEGCHTNQSEDGVTINLISLGVCVGFDGDVEYPHPVHYDLLKKQIKDWQKEYQIPNINVKFHRYFNLFKTCPGGLLKSNWLDTLLTEEDETEIIKPPTQEEKKEKLISIQNQLGIVRIAVLKLQELFNIIFKKS